MNSLNGIFQGHFGEIASLLVAVFWSITALSFEYASKSVGSLPVNFIRLVLAFIFLMLLNLILRGSALPADASVHNWIWLSVSGLIGFVLGDFFLFKSYAIIGSWFAMLIMTLAPPMAAVFGWILLGEKLSLQAIAGMLITLSGISLAIFKPDKISKKLRLNKPLPGIVFACAGAFGQALGLVFSKYGMQGYNPFAATQIRILAGIAGFTLVISFSRRWLSVKHATKNKKALAGISTGSFFGPFLGVSFSLVAIKYTSTGIASTIMALVPIFIIPFSIILFNHKITLHEILGTVISLCGVAIFFL